ncbi:MAG: hypothetical protein SNJ67_13155 [Chloracidobacterium sp.]|uniref:Zinc-finger domain-containing protein n=1 Tax=Chloracidobacterium validum TaxID=2821543 RepID=A0ABX8BCA4_9BACT|nr:hypothetical protein [Chloracidobacterium validum]QUW03268.1 hypothetical protein J8C06_02180 [Chloracidobacterium validum]
MAKCQVIRRQLEAVEHEPDAHLPAEVGEHLDQCVHCRAYVVQMQTLRTLLSEQPRVMPPATFDAEIRLRLGREAHRFREPFLAWIPTPALAVLAVAVVVTSALAVRSSMQMVLQSPPTVAEAVALPTLPERALATALSVQLASSLPPAPISTATPRMTLTPSRLGRATSTTTRRTGPAADANGVVVLWRGRTGERVMRLPSVVYGVQPVLERRSAAEGESSDNSVF